MEKEKQSIITEYPESFPIKGPLLEVFTERLKTFFNACDSWSCSHDGSLPEKLLTLRQEMQKSIDYPPMHCTEVVRPANAFRSSEAKDCRLDEWVETPSIIGEDPEDLHVRTLISPEVRLSWKGLQVHSMEYLPPAVRDAGLDLASRVLGVHIYYGYQETLQGEDWDGNPDDPQPHPLVEPVCPFARHGPISKLMKNWSPADRGRLSHHVRRHIGIAAVIGFIIGMVLGALMTLSTFITPGS